MGDLEVRIPRHTRSINQGEVMNTALAVWRMLPFRPRCASGHHLSLCRLLTPRMGWVCEDHHVSSRS